jgi:hypothetical protein
MTHPRLLRGLARHFLPYSDCSIFTSFRCFALWLPYDPEAPNGPPALVLVHSDGFHKVLGTSSKGAISSRRRARNTTVQDTKIAPFLCIARRLPSSRLVRLTRLFQTRALLSLFQLRTLVLCVSQLCDMSSLQDSILSVSPFQCLGGSFH